jgi:hypothetical protein
MVIRAASCLILLFFIAGRSFPNSTKVNVQGVIVESVTNAPVFDATIIQDYPAANGIMLKDSVFSDSQGKFQAALLDSTRFSHSLTFEKDGYKTRTVQFSAQFDPQTVRLDTVFMSPYTVLDTVIYRISGSVTDSDNEAVRGATVSIQLSQQGAALFSVTVTASQLGGYFNVTTRQPYRPFPMTARVQSQAPGFNPADESQTLVSSSPDFVINPVMKRISNSVAVAVRKLIRATAPVTMNYTINGRKVETGAQRFPGTAVVRLWPDGTGRVDVQLK